jgi:hypothetical protein
MKRTLAAAAFVLAAAPALAHAGDGALADNDWRRPGRHWPQSPQNFAFELRFGSYLPQIDSDSRLHAKPYETVFGGDRAIYFGLEIDWQALRIPYFGTLGPGFGWGYVHKTATAVFAPDSATPGLPSGEETHLTIMPMYLAAVLRVDVLAREVQIPIVPYVKGGFGYGLWSATNDLGVSRSKDGTLGHGHTTGTHFALGGMLLLDPLDPSAALGFDEELGVNHSYVFFEWQMPSLNGQFSSAPQMHIGTSSWVLGLALEF